ncbi:MAG TPA: hypothetical protein DD465_21710, partial [Thalassospira sp.]|nr:hypothetical protein [Thalassospira sp.]
MADMQNAGNDAGYFIGIDPPERAINMIFLDLWPCARLRANNKQGESPCMIFRGNQSGLPVPAAAS